MLLEFKQLFHAKYLMAVETVLIFAVVSAFSSNYAEAQSPISNGHCSMNINMPDVTARTRDSYICTAKKLNAAESYITQYEPDADSSKAHHMMLFGCKGLLSQDHLYPGQWSCGGELCNGMTIIYGWAKSAPAMTLPPNVGHLVGGNSSIQYLVLQLHYAQPFSDGVTDNSGLKLHMTTERQPYITGIYLLMAQRGLIAPHKQSYHIDVNCKFRHTSPIHVFAYRAHTHRLGTVVTGYKYNEENNSWTFLAKGNPQWPQAFYPIRHSQAITNHDILVSRCVYNTSRLSVPTYLGSSATDEMCNLYLMYYTEYRNSNLGQIPPCIGIEYNALTHDLPPGSDEPLMVDHDLGQLDRVPNEHFAGDDPATVEAPPLFLTYKSVPKWPSLNISFGQISAVTIDSKGHVVIFHRGNHVWNERTFDNYNRYLLEEEGPIPMYTVVSIDPASGNAVHSWGHYLFFMPHGLSIDHKGSFWLTDVALHQVFRFAPNDLEKPALVLGKKFVPGQDNNHFCKPTSVAVHTSGDIYVADGYCNSRIMKFTYFGKYITQWGKSSNFFDRHPPVGTFNIPHKVVLIEERDLVCVADRENGRIQCFNTIGDFRFKIQRDEFEGSLFSIAYDKSQDLLFCVNGGSVLKDGFVKVFVFNATTQKLVTVFSPTHGSFSQPHDLAVSSDGGEVYVGEIGPDILWKFVREYDTSTKKSKPENTSRLHNHVHMTTWRITKIEDPPSEVVITEEDNNSSSNNNKNFETSVVIMALLGIPILLLILFTVIIRMRQKGKLQGICLGQLKGWMGGYRTPHPQEKFNLGNFFNPHKGFDKVSVVESDGDDDGVESEKEEFIVMTKNA